MDHQLERKDCQETQVFQEHLVLLGCWDKRDLVASQGFLECLGEVVRKVYLALLAPQELPDCVVQKVTEGNPEESQVVWDLRANEGTEGFKVNKSIPYNDSRKGN
uniref:Uncharacterized protein n=1 Tax=Micrurus corallinus TaxID=54390 RepID=A0A2D4H503_MICCO